MDNSYDVVYHDLFKQFIKDGDFNKFINTLKERRIEELFEFNLTGARIIVDMEYELAKDIIKYIIEPAMLIAMSTVEDYLNKAKGQRRYAL